MSRPGPVVHPGLVIRHGARAAEEALLADLDALLPAGTLPERLEGLASPVRVVVPSRSLRRHLAASLVRRRGRALAGVAVHTLRGLALEILERAGEPAPSGALLFEVLVRRFAREAPALRDPLEELVDGYAAASASARDLLDAGLEPAHEAALAEAVRTVARGSPGAAGRAAALVEVAAATHRAMEALGTGRTSTALVRARAVLERNPEALPARAVLVHGIADATGVATDFVEALVRTKGARVYLDRPPDPAAALEGDQAEPGFEEAFSRRFAERLGAVTGQEPRGGKPEQTPEPPHVQLFEAPGTSAEVFELGRRLRELLDAGARPEGLAVVARDLSGYRLALRRRFERLGIPFSGLASRGSLLAAGRKVRALGELLRRGGEVPADRWLDSLAARRGALVDLRLGFRALGAGRLHQAAALRVEKVLVNGSLPLPIRQGFSVVAGSRDEEPADDSAQRSLAARRRLDGKKLEQAVAQARALLELLEKWPAKAPAGRHLERLETLLREHLGWEPAQGAAKPAFDALERAAAEVPGSLELGRDELHLLLDRLLAEVGWSDLGGKGGGVQVLTVTEARGLTFEHLFVVGMNRDLFPRTVQEDPLLPDALRGALLPVLPDLPIKARGFDEERFLFAQLLSSSPRVTLSWQSVSDDGESRPPSPLIEPLRRILEAREGAFESVLPLYGRREGEAPAAAPGILRPADEHAVRAALHGGRRAFRARFPAVAAARCAALPAVSRPEPAALARAQLAVLDAVDPDFSTPEGRARRRALSPYFGFVGPVEGAADPRRREVFVTLLENLAACPWQTFVERLLRIEATPDPLEALPRLDPLLLGQLVHAVLERAIKAALGKTAPESLGDALAREPTPVPWPQPLGLEMILWEEASRLLAEAGIGLAGLSRALGSRARPLLEAAAASDWAEGPLAALGSEVEGEVEVGGAASPRSLRFRADAVDFANGRPRLTDYKTGRPIDRGKQASTRRRNFLRAVAEGSKLQAVAYQLASGQGQGRYLFLKDGIEEDARVFAVEAADADFHEAFHGAVATLLEAWDAGTFFPRLTEPARNIEPARCRFCDVAEACLRQDSGARKRLFDFAQRAAEEDPPEGPYRPMLDVWELPGGGRRG